MTVEETLCQATESLILPSNRTFYPIKIPSKHWQLRNYISSTDPGFIYYASNKDIYCLHTSTRKRELIAVLPWAPICLAAAFGWIVVGGLEKGRCAFVKLRDNGVEGPSPSSSRRHADVDALLPLDLDPESRFQAHHFLAGSRPDSDFIGVRKAEVQIQELGSDIVNSVTIHRLRGDGKEFQDEFIAVMTNNDHTVRIFSLTQSRGLDTLHFPSPMNHATISPDGSLLVAVGDEPHAYFHKRVTTGSIQVQNGPVLLRNEWQLIASPLLQVTGPEDGGMCFTTAFSPSGHICAVASQHGIITIFDTSSIMGEEEDDDAVIEIFRSSRASLPHSASQIGAPRSMCFSPAPWDLLAWAEDHGRVCVADARHAFRSRQTIELDVDDPEIDRAEITDLADELIHPELRALTTEARFVRQYREARDAQDDAAAVNFAADYIEASAERRRLQREARERVPGNPESSAQGLTERERQLLDTLRTSRERMNERERAEAQQQSPFSVNHLPPPRSIRVPNDDVSYEEYMGLPTTSSSTSSRASATLRDYIRERNLERSRTGDRTYQPRRRSSIVVSNNSASEPTSSTLAPRPGSSTFTVSPTRLSNANPPAPTTSTTDPWQTIEAAMQNGPLPDAATRLRREREAAIEANFERRQQQWARMEATRNQRIRQLYDGGGEGLDRYEVDLLRRARYRTDDPDAGIGTMGLGWSEDGRQLQVPTLEF
ncbi:MAG: hypothetical protein M1830_002748 [Pleopsidium flavum]|nr:MAG: hypothetical protein M1830_002748 [Pleopsidium flavum]